MTTTSNSATKSTLVYVMASRDDTRCFWKELLWEFWGPKREWTTTFSRVPHIYLYPENLNPSKSSLSIWFEAKLEVLKIPAPTPRHFLNQYWRSGVISSTSQFVFSVCKCFVPICLKGQVISPWVDLFANSKLRPRRIYEVQRQIIMKILFTHPLHYMSDILGPVSI